MNDVELASLEELPKTQDESKIIAGTLVQFMIRNRTSKPLEELSSPVQKTEFMGDVIRRAINNIDNSIFHPARHKAMQDVQDSEVTRHSLVRMSFQPQAKHQNIPKFRSTVSVSGLVLVPYLFDKRFRKIRIFPFEDVRASEVMNAIAEPIG
jgi:hypothetical protein